MDALTRTAASATASATGSAAQPPKPEQSGVISSDFETFLKMLTAQIQNQDPLNPMDSSDYAVQLATFSSVEQQVLTNDLLREMGGGGGTLAGYADWIGKEAAQRGPVAFEGRPVELALDIPAGATSTELQVSTLAGDRLSSAPVDATATTLTWDGSGPAGALPTGPYIVETVSRMGDGGIERRPVRSHARIDEVRLGAGGAELVLASGAVLRPDEVEALRLAR